ncbi:MAG: sigma-70 family RNA polymerase sigma factor [Verrucomicrobiota bacterium]|mgnify:CR=1 FL=1|nr:sigma-70 family RNA polymerase sigma factor [Verrucomicrobiota bacterium]
MDITKFTPLPLNDENQWVDLHGDYLFRYALSRVSSEHNAEDLVQETFLTALKSKDAFEGRSTQRTWLTGILRNKIMEHYRKGARFKGIPVDESYEQCSHELMDKHKHWDLDPNHSPADWAPSPSQCLENSEFWVVIQQCVGKLPVKASQVYIMREIDGLDTSEICAVTGVSESNLWVLLHRCRFLLRRCLELNWFVSPAKATGGDDQ